MVTIAQAVAEIRPELSSSFAAQVLRDAERIGVRAGEAMSGGVGRGLNSVVAESEQVGRKAGDKMAGGIASAMERDSRGRFVSSTRRGLDGVVTESESTGTRAGDRLSSGISGGLSKITGRLKGEFGKFKTEFRSQIGDVSTVAAGMLVGGGIEAGFRAIGNFIGGAIQAANDLEQAVGGTKAVFEDSSFLIASWARDAQDDMGLSERAFREGTSQIGANLKRMGFDVRDSAELSKQVLQDAADASATFGGTAEEATEALGAAFRGEADPAERFGFALQVTAVQAEAAKRGMGNVRTGTREYGEVLVDMIREQNEANGATGQFAREADTAAGKAQILRAQLENLKSESGETWQSLQATGLSAQILGINALDSIPGLKGLQEVLGFVGQKVGAATGDTEELSEAVQAAAHRMEGAADPANHMGAALAKVDDKAVDLSADLESLNTAIDEMIKPILNLSDAQSGFEAAVDAASASVKENGRTLDIHREKGRANKQALDNIAESTWELIGAQKENGAQTGELTRTTELGRKKFVDAAVAMGKTQEEARELADRYGLTRSASDKLRDRTEAARKKFIEQAIKIGATRDEAKDLADKYGLIPGKVETKVTAPGLGQVRSDVSKLTNALQGLSADVIKVEFKSGLGDGLGILSGLGQFGGGLMGISPSSAVGQAYSSMGRPGDVISGYRPGARTLSGNLSYHAQGRALDITPAIGIAHAIRRNFFGRTRELITPWPSLGIHNGRSHRYSDAVQAQHDGRTNVRHIHWAMADGGAGTVTKPTVFMAGERGTEDFAFAPHSKGGMADLLGAFPDTVTVNLHLDGQVIDQRVVALTNRRQRIGAQRRFMGAG